MILRKLFFLNKKLISKLPLFHFTYYIFYSLLFICLFSYSGIYSQEREEKISRENIEKLIEKVFFEYENEDNHRNIPKVLKFIEQHNIKIKDNGLNGLLKCIRGGYAVSLGNMESSLKYYKEARELLKKSDRKLEYGLTYNYIGIINADLKQHNQSLRNIKKSIEIIESLEESHYAIDVYYNLAKGYINNEKWKEVSQNAEKSISLIKKFNKKKSRIGYLNAYVGRSQVKLENFKKAKIYLENAIKVSKDYDFGLLEYIHNSYIMLYEKTGNLDKLAYHLKSTLQNFKKDKDFKSNKLNKATNVEYELNRKIEEIHNNKLSIQKKILFGSICVLLISIFLLYRYYKMHKKSKSNEDQIKSMLIENERKLFSNTYKASTKRDLIKNMNTKIEKILNSKEIKKSDLLSFSRDLSVYLDEDEVWSEFKLHFEKTNPGFFENLLKRNDKLTINDLKHCCYIASRLSVKDVARLTAVSTRTVETTRYRLKKKLKLDTETNLIQFLYAM